MTVDDVADELHRDKEEIKQLITKRNIAIKGADALTVSGFTQALNAILKSKQTSPAARLNYAMLLSYARQNDYCCPRTDPAGQRNRRRRPIGAHVPEDSPRRKAC